MPTKAEWNAMLERLTAAMAEAGFTSMVIDMDAYRREVGDSDEAEES